MPLTDAKLRSLKPAEKPYKVSDSEGLHVLVTTTGSLLWRFAYRFSGKQKLLALGAYPFVKLAHLAVRSNLDVVTCRDKSVFQFLKRLGRQTS